MYVKIITMDAIYIVIIFILLLAIISIIYSHFKIDISFYDVKNKKIDKNIKIVFLSDLHNRNFIDKLVNKVNSINPDIIIFGGDMVNEKMKDTIHFVELIGKLKDKTIYYTYGNHEENLEPEDRKDYDKIILSSKLITLNNAHKSLSHNVMLYGLDSENDTYMDFGKLGLSKKYITNKLGVIDQSKFNILIAHNPLEFDSYVESKYDLVLSGHIHGGVIRLPFKKGLLSPDVTFFPKYFHKSYIKDKTQMIVSRGLGYSKRIPFRINNPAEIVVVNIMKEK